MVLLHTERSTYCMDDVVKISPKDGPKLLIASENQEVVVKILLTIYESWESVNSDEEVTDANRNDIVFSFFNIMCTNTNNERA